MIEKAKCYNWQVKDRNWQAWTIILRIYSIADPSHLGVFQVERRQSGWHADSLISIKSYSKKLIADSYALRHMTGVADWSRWLRIMSPQYEIDSGWLHLGMDPQPSASISDSLSAAIGCRIRCVSHYGSNSGWKNKSAFYPPYLRLLLLCHRHEGDPRCSKSLIWLLRCPNYSFNLLSFPFDLFIGLRPINSDPEGLYIKGGKFTLGIIIDVGNQGYIVLKAFLCQ